MKTKKYDEIYVAWMLSIVRHVLFVYVVFKMTALGRYMCPISNLVLISLTSIIVIFIIITLRKVVVFTAFFHCFRDLFILFALFICVWNIKINQMYWCVKWFKTKFILYKYIISVCPEWNPSFYPLDVVHKDRKSK